MVIVVVIAVLVIALTVPFPKESFSGSVPIQDQGGTDQYEGVSTYSQQSSGSVAITWQTSSPAVLVIVIVISGSCAAVGGVNCTTVASDGVYVCISGIATDGPSSSGTCDYNGDSGAYTIIVISTAGLLENSTLTYSAQVSGPLL